MKNARGFVVFEVVGWLLTIAQPTGGIVPRRRESQSFYFLTSDYIFLYNFCRGSRVGW